MARPAVIPALQGHTVATAAQDTTRPQPNPCKSSKDASTQSPSPEPADTKATQDEPQPARASPVCDVIQNPIVNKRTAKSLPDRETTTYIARTDEDLIPALQLVSDSVAQQRQLAARALILHPVTWLPILLSIPYLLVERAHDSSDWLVILITIACIIIFIMTVIKVVVHGYLEAAERIGRWSWLYGDRWVKNRFIMTRPDGKTAKMPRPVDDDHIFITKLGEEVIATIVLRVVDVQHRDPDMVAMDKRGIEKGGIKVRGREIDEIYRRKKVSFRAWTVKQIHRGQGVGLALLRFVVRWALDSDVGVLVFADDHAHSLRVLPAFLNEKMDSQDERARETLYWEVKHYSTPWHMEQREQKKAALRAAEVKAQKAKAKAKENPSPGLHRYHRAFNSIPAPYSSRTIRARMLAPMKSFTPQPSRSSLGPMDIGATAKLPERVASMPPLHSPWFDRETAKDVEEATKDGSSDSDEGSGFTPDDAEISSNMNIGAAAKLPERVASVPFLRPPWFDRETANDVEEATKDGASDSDEGSGFTPDDAETPSKEAVAHQAINYQYMRDTWEECKRARKAESPDSWGKCTPSEDSLPGPSTLNTGYPIHPPLASGTPSGQENPSPATASTTAPTKTNEGTPSGKPFGPGLSNWADPLREEILRRSTNKLGDRQTHISCESCGCTVTQTDRVNLSSVSPPSVWFGHHSPIRLCSSCGLHRIRESIARLERSAQGDDGNVSGC